MPQADNSRGGVTRARKVKRSAPASRPDAAQRTGARTPKPTPPGKPVQRGHASEGGKTIQPKTIQKIRETNPSGRGKSDAAQGNSTREAERRSRGKSDAAQGNQTRAADAYKSTPEYTAAQTAARRATIRRSIRDRKPIPKSTTTATKGELPEAVRAELEGRGKVAGFLSKVGDEVAKPRGKEGGKGAGGQSFATIFASRLVPGYGAAPKKVKQIGERAAKDLVNFPAQAVPSVYVPAAGVVEAAKGRPERLKKYVEDVKQTDPIYNTVAAGVEAVKGNKKAAKSHIRKAGKAASEHPGFTALEVYGAKGTFGRGTGRVMRSGVTGKRAKRAASTRREPAVVPGTKIAQKREYSPDVITKAVQVKTPLVGEKAKIRRAEKTRANARKEQDPDTQVELLRKANRQDPRVASAREVQRRVDERVDANEGVRRIHRTQAQAGTRKIVQKVRPSDRPAISVVAQNITRASKDDIRAYISELKGQHPTLDPAGKRANTRLRRDLQRIVDDPKADLGKVETAAREYEAFTAPKQAKLVKSGLLAPGRGEKAKLIPYAVRNMGLKHDKDLGVVTESGIPVSAEQIRLHMEANGVKEPAFLTQAPNQRGARNFNIRSERAQSISRRRRTGDATLKGLLDANPETLTENAARAQGLVDATDGFRGFVDELAVRQDKMVETHQTKALADARKDNLEAETGERYRAIRLNPFDAAGEQLQALLDDVNSDNQLAPTGTGDKSPVVQAIEQAIHRDASGDGPWALIPETAAAQLQKHLNVMASTGAAGKTLQMINSNFRKTVLSTSPTWATGNVVEGGFRTALAKAGPLAYLTGRKALKTLSDEDLLAAEEVALRTIGGGHFSSADRMHVRRDAEQFRDTRLEGTAQALGKFWRTPGPKHAAAAWHHYTQFVFENMRRVESQFQTAMLGKAIRQSELFDDKIIGLSDAAMKDVAKGLKDTNNVVALGRSVDRMYGKYGKDSPEIRLAKAYYTPFISWYLNAVKFVVDVLPRDHPTATALIVQAELATEEWRKDHGLDMFMQGAVPGWLQGSIPLPGGGKLRAPNRYLPFAAFGDPLATASGQVLPQFMGPVLAGMGLDWSGSPLNGPSGSEPDQAQKASAVATAFFGGQIPALSLGLRVGKKGLAGALNPAAVTAPTKAKTKLRKVTDPWSDAGTGGIKWSDDTSGGIAWPD